MASQCAVEVVFEVVAIATVVQMVDVVAAIQVIVVVAVLDPTSKPTTSSTSPSSVGVITAVVVGSLCSIRSVVMVTVPIWTRSGPMSKTPTMRPMKERMVLKLSRPMLQEPSTSRMMSALALVLHLASAHAGTDSSVTPLPSAGTVWEDVRMCVRGGGMGVCQRGRNRGV